MSKIITLEEAKKADYNISPSRFVSVFEEEKYRSIYEIKKDLERVENERKIVDEKVNKILYQLN